MKHSADAMEQKGMTKLSIRDRTVITLYVKSRLSFESVARKMGLGTSTVQDIMRLHARDKIRGNNSWRNPKSDDEGLTLTSLGLYQVGDCTKCLTPIVSYTRERGQMCGFCKAAA